MCVAYPPLSVSLQGRGGPHRPPSVVRADAPLLSALIPQKVEPPLQPSAINPSPLIQILALPLQLNVPPLQPLSARAPPPPLSVLLQGRGKPHLLPSTVRAYVPMIYALLLRKDVPLRQSPAEPDPLNMLSALISEQVKPNIKPSDINPPPLPQL